MGSGPTQAEAGALRLSPEPRLGFALPPCLAGLPAHPRPVCVPSIPSAPSTLRRAAPGVPRCPPVSPCRMPRPPPRGPGPPVEGQTSGSHLSSPHHGRPVGRATPTGRSVGEDSRVSTSSRSTKAPGGEGPSPGALSSVSRGRMASHEGVLAFLVFKNKKFRLVVGRVFARVSETPALRGALPLTGWVAPGSLFVT